MGRQKVPKSDFQSQLSMSKIIQIFLIFFFIEEYHFRGRFFIVDQWPKLNLGFDVEPEIGILKVM